ncbi:histone H4-like TAF Taf6, SAGA complex subunit [Dispira parvispora]|uniref:TBP-associated factor 6 n=1 Tax=Dispira parvispora TaxID=1520584 RepID=A0A9W8E4L7_9FUNG|nr:histone H4-like TAF Taf6, SAGA complex subunit [Dispira parvispora]
MTVFPKESIRNISQSLGIPKLKDDVASALSQDVEYRIYEIIQEATKFMRHSSRTKLTTEDIDYALRVKNVEPLYGHNSFGEVGFKRVESLAEELYIIEDEELDFEKVIKTPLPAAPRDVTYTVHWLAVEGVQPAIRQNPVSAQTVPDHPTKKLRGEGGTRETITTQSAHPRPGEEVKPLVKHVLSKELQLYFDRVTDALLSDNDVLRATALESLGVDPGIHQLVPYFTQFIANQTTHHLKQLRVLHTMVLAARALLSNPRVFVEPYLHQLMPALLTCLVGKRLGEVPSELSVTHEPSTQAMDIEEPSSYVRDHWALRDTAAQLVARICKEYGQAYHTLQHRITRTLLRAFLDPTKPFSTHYGAIVGLTQLGTPVVKLLLLPNIKAYSTLLSAPSANSTVAQEKDKCYSALLAAVKSLASEAGEPDSAQGQAIVTDGLTKLLQKHFGEDFTKRLVDDPTAWSAIPVALAAVQAGPSGDTATGSNTSTEATT